MLLVGATIEDVNIRDLDNVINATDKSDLIEMYEKLKSGSGIHMRAFTSQLAVQGETYVPQFITQDQYDAIIDGVHEHCGRQFFVVSVYSRMNGLEPRIRLFI